MKPAPTLSTIAAMLALTTTSLGVHAQMGTPAPSGPPSTQPAPKSPSQPATGESVKDMGGPQITVPLKRQRLVAPVEAASDPASQPAKGKSTG